MEWNIWRAPTDNDRNSKHRWYDAGYNRAYARAYGTETETDGCVTLRSTINITANAMRSIVRADVVWTVKSDGGLRLSVRARLNDNEPYFDMPFLPRFGIRAFLPREYDDVAYYGFGPRESYSDKHLASYVGLFRSAVSDMGEDYIKPQENGSRFGCKYLSLSATESKLQIYGSSFSFNASEYTAEELELAAHNYELEKCGMTVLCVDYRQAGIGSNSCGPELSDREKIEKEFEWTIDIVPQP